jgi:hypothetical protein
MPFDPSVISTIGPSAMPDIAGTQTKAFQLKDLMQEGQLHALQLKDYQTEQADRAKVKDILNKAGPIDSQTKANEIVGRVRKEVNPEMAMKLHQQFSQERKDDLEEQLARLQVQREQAQVQSTQINSVLSLVTPLATQLQQGGYEEGKVNPAQDAMVREKIPQMAQQLKQQHPELSTAIDQILSNTQQWNKDSFMNMWKQSTQAKEQLERQIKELEAKKLKHEIAMGGKQVVTTESESTNFDTREITKTPHISIVDKATGKVTDTGAEAAPKGGAAAGGGRDAVYTSRIISAGEEALGDAKNVMEMPLGSNVGWLASKKGEGGGIMASVRGGLANKLTSQDAQNYGVISAGLQRNLAAIETAGLATPGSLTHQMDAVIIQPGDSNETAMRKLAQTRQIVENGLKNVLNKPTVNPEQKKEVKAIIDGLKEAIPFTQHDITEWKSKGKRTQSFDDYAKSKGLGGTTPSTTTSGATVSNW